MHHTWQNAPHLKKNAANLKQCAALRKLRHTLKNARHLQKCATLGKLGNT